MKPFNPNDYPFEIHGFFEEFLDAETHKFLGVRKIAAPDREIGAAGMQVITLTEPLELVKGYKQIPVTIKATKTKPRKVMSMLQIITGKTKRKD